jgi:hypothetical protein
MSTDLVLLSQARALSEAGGPHLVDFNCWQLGPTWDGLRFLSAAIIASDDTVTALAASAMARLALRDQGAAGRAVATLIVALTSKFAGFGSMEGELAATRIADAVTERNAHSRAGRRLQ